VSAGELNGDSPSLSARKRKTDHNDFIDDRPWKHPDSGCSKNNRASARSGRPGSLSKFDRGDWKNLYQNYELDEYWHRVQAREAEAASVCGKIAI